MVLTMAVVLGGSRMDLFLLKLRMVPLHLCPLFSLCATPQRLLRHNQRVRRRAMPQGLRLLRHLSACQQQPLLRPRLRVQLRPRSQRRQMTSCGPQQGVHEKVIQHAK